MTIQPINIASILSAPAWPGVVVAAFIIFRRSGIDLARLAGDKITKLSFAGITSSSRRCAT